ncbi:cellulose biosynthesis protein BcsS [Cupriavidus consociatus]|uniref:cellulose biosynthesis protein BcsS n=1 Tax=Cupriavidus consociatus TaxID=2821357 RepID=UPI001AE46E78|nr:MULTISPECIES: cellulose biosynthesis protein BcsS [unclassified Cupriavidus]MBP0623233.1 cellulose biosynthesis protein BcsS [Cupriavidus sp. LEh25]MDK2659926.1 cellulose biosynthesis protein BcsS [Cupriavidus sp. LEh21]
MTRYMRYAAARPILAVAILSGSCWLATPAQAGPFVFGGASFAGGGERSEYAGVSSNLLPVPFLTQKFVVSDYHYKYGTNGTTVSVNGQAAEAAIGLQKGWEGGWAEASVGARYRYNRVSPEGADNRTDGGEWGLGVTVLGQQEFATRWAVNGIASYNFGPKAYWARGRLLYKAFGEAWAGVEIIKHGDPYYHSTQGGLVLTGISLGKDLNLGVFAGAKKTAGEPRSFYGGLEISKAF